MATKVFTDIEENQVLCSRVNAGSLERGDVVWNEQGTLCYWVTSTRKIFKIGRIVLSLDRTPGSVRLGFNTPVWREVGARAGGLIH